MTDIRGVGLPLRRRHSVRFHHEAGTAELGFGGSRDHDRDGTGYNCQLQVDWSNIQQ
jgi:hypothetical protein